MITNTISVTELIWTLFCGIGLVYNSKILLRALGDFYEIKAKRINSIREYSARLTVFVYSMLTFIQFVFVFIGVIAMTLPPQNTHESVNAFSVLLTSCFILVSIVLAIGSFINETGRQKLLNKIKELEQF